MRVIFHKGILYANMQTCRSSKLTASLNPVEYEENFYKTYIFFSSFHSTSFDITWIYIYYSKKILIFEICKFLSAHRLPHLIVRIRFVFCISVLFIYFVFSSQQNDLHTTTTACRCFTLLQQRSISLLLCPCSDWNHYHWNCGTDRDCVKLFGRGR